MTRTKSIYLALLAVLLSPMANADLITVSTSDNPVRPGMDNQGWWLLGEPNTNATNDNYITGGEFHSYFSFDLAGIAGMVVGATLEVRRYNTSAGSTLDLWDVGTSAVDLAQRLIVDDAIWTDLGSGTNYGSFIAGAGSSFDIMSFSLNAAALADINAGLGSFFSIGGTSSGGTHFSSSGFEPGNSDQNYVQRLVLDVVTVPEPSTLALLGIGLLGMGAARRRKTA